LYCTSNHRVNISTLVGEIFKEYSLRKETLLQLLAQQSLRHAPVISVFLSSSLLVLLIRFPSKIAYHTTSWWCFMVAGQHVVTGVAYTQNARTFYVLSDAMYHIVLIHAHLTPFPVFAMWKVVLPILYHVVTRTCLT
jgi:hypothetical protein